MKSREDWDDYNSDESSSGVIINSGIYKGYPAIGETYTSFFFKKFNLNAYLDTKCKSILQFGAARGEDLKRFKDQGYESVMGYDYTDSSIKRMRAANIPCRQIDLNRMDPSQTSLQYADELKSDLKSPVNIFAIRVFQYLDTKPLLLLLYTLIDNAPKGSRFFIIGSIKESPQPAYQRSYIGLPFFTRTDIRIITHEFTGRKDSTALQDEIMVLAKI
ncbi:MAG: hypothetical protein ACYCQI_04820 [Gammaproteobacteria bacterium]